jgi:hypothetical protein
VRGKAGKQTGRGDDATGRSDGEAPLSRLESLMQFGFVGALVLLSFVAGAVLTAGEIFPGPQISRAYQGGQALYGKLTKYRDFRSTDLWFPQARSESGVTAYDPAKAQDGVTLYTSGGSAAAFLVDMDGNVLHEWRRPFSTVWRAGTGGVSKPQPDSHVFFHKAVLQPNGDLLAIYEGVGDTPYGYGLVKLDRNSEVIWTYFGRAHHDMGVGPDGKIYVLTHGIVDGPLDGFEHLRSPRIEDYLVVLSPDGEELKKVALVPAVARSAYRHLLHTLGGYGLGDPLHANGVDFITPEAAANFAFGEAGQALLSFREPGAIAVLDLESEEIVWAARGVWIAQHDPDILPNGNILLFDNHGNFARPEGRSRVIEFNPRSMEIVWSYSGTSERPLDSTIRSSQQRLANGNTLITESNGGRLLEVTPEGEIAWEYLNPLRAGEGGEMIAAICWARRLDRASIDPALLARPRQPGLSAPESST